jgi:hypothetical protein
MLRKLYAYVNDNTDYVIGMLYSQLIDITNYVRKCLCLYMPILSRQVDLQDLEIV